MSHHTAHLLVEVTHSLWNNNGDFRIGPFPCINALIQGRNVVYSLCLGGRQWKRRPGWYQLFHPAEKMYINNRLTLNQHFNQAQTYCP